MQITEWKLEDEIHTPDDLVEFMLAAIEENNMAFFYIACKDVIRIAKLKGWLYN